MRYGVFSVTGYAKPSEGGNHPPKTTWYVYDSAYCGEIVFASDLEHEAMNEKLRLNIAERTWEKEQERALRADA